MAMAEPVAEAVLPDDCRVALVHDWLTGMRGGEKCLEVMAELYPQADLFTLLHVPGSVSPTIERLPITTSFVQRLPRARTHYRWALPLFPRAVEAFDLSGYDLVLSSSHCVAKGAIKASQAVAVCYCHTPMRYVWDRFDDYFGHKPRALRTLIRWQSSHLRSWDLRTVGRVDHWLANSTAVRRRLLDWYDVPADRTEIVFPPVAVERFAGVADLPSPDGLSSGSYDFVLSALVPYKRIDLAVQAAVRAGRTLVVAGDGPEARRLRELVAATSGPGRVLFAGAVSDDELPALYAHCRAFVFPGLEDFGITPLEATAAGRPVVAYRAGGALDTIVEGLNGVFCEAQTVEAVAAALADARLDGSWDRQTMQRHAAGFSREVFRDRLQRAVAGAWRRHRQDGGDR